jgi:tetratricopeptide (TPR) repeat protein
MGGIESLLDQSMLRRSEKDGESRFWMYETIREFAQEQLDRSRENQSVYQAFSRYFTREEFLQDYNQMELEIDNLRAVLRWSIDSGNAGPGLLLGGDFLFWMTHATEARSWLRELLNSPGAQEVKERFDGVYGAMGLAYFNGDQAETIEFFKECEDLVERDHDNQDLQDFFLYAHGIIAAMQGRYDQAIMINQEFVQIWKKRGGKFLIQAGLSAWASIELVVGNVAKARELLQAASEIPYENNMGRCNQFERETEIGLCDLDENKFDAASQRFKEGILRAQESGYRLMYNFCLRGLAATACKRNQLEQSARLYGATEKVSILLGHTTLLPGWETLHQRYLAFLREQIDPQVFEHAFQEGRSMSLDEALAYALEKKSLIHAT